MIFTTNLLLQILAISGIYYFLMITYYLVDKYLKSKPQIKFLIKPEIVFWVTLLTSFCLFSIASSIVVVTMTHYFTNNITENK